MIERLRARGIVALGSRLLFTLPFAAGCGGASGGGSPAAVKEPAALTCPVLQGAASQELAGLFGIDVALAGRISRTMRLMAELERAAKALDSESRAVCSALARDLDLGAAASSPAGGHPCELAAERLASLRQAFGAGGFAVSVSDVACGIPRDLLARCAGECLTGRTDVVSSVECKSADVCGLDFTMPDASPQCATQCGARALRELRCTASVDVRLSAAAGSRQLSAEQLDSLRRDLPRLVAFGASMGPRAADLVAQVKALIDELGESIDQLTASARGASKRDASTANAPLDRRVVVGAVLAGCVAPALADTLRASSSLEGSIGGAVALHAALLGR